MSAQDQTPPLILRPARTLRPVIRPVLDPGHARVPRLGPAGTPAFAPPQQPARVQTRGFASTRTVLALILREMATRYGRSPGGYLWAVLEPLGAVLILAAGFSLLMRNPPLGSSFLLFYATGYMPFSLYQSVSNMVARSISFSRPLLMYPSVTWVDAVIARFLLNTLTGVMVTYLLLSGMLVLTDTRTVIDLGPILSAMFMAALLGLGVGVMNCLLNGLMPVWEQIWSILSRPLFLASGIIAMYEDMPQAVQDILWYNPVMHIVSEMRAGFYPMYTADYVSPVFVIAVALVAIALGFVLLQRYHRDILNDG